MSTFKEIASDLSAGKYAPVYFLQGEEPYYIDYIIQFIEKHALDETQKSFNQVVLYGKDTTITDILTAARRYPMMGERQVVIIKEAQELKGWTKADSQKLLINYLENPLASTILVFGYKYKSVDKRTSFGKSVAKLSVFFASKKLYDNEVPGWIQAYCNEKKVAISQAAVMMLSENIGNNLQRIANEIDKVVINLKNGDEIDEGMVQKYIGINKDFNVFELQKAIGSGNQAKAFQIVNYFASNPSNNPMVLTIYSLFTYFSKLLLLHHAGDQNDSTLANAIGVNPYFLKEYRFAARNYSMGKVIENISHIKQADLQSKGIESAPRKEKAVLSELVHKLMN